MTAVERVRERYVEMELLKAEHWAAFNQLTDHSVKRSADEIKRLNDVMHVKGARLAALEEQAEYDLRDVLDAYDALHAAIRAHLAAQDEATAAALREMVGE